MPKFLLFFLFLTTSFFLNAQELASPFITNYTHKQYSFSGQNWNIIQDKRGLIYIANNSGVMEYDGKTWRKILIKGNKGTISPKMLCMDKRGTIFVGGRGDFGLLVPDSLGVLSYQSISSSLDSTIVKGDSQIWWVRIIDDIVYFCDFATIYKYSIKDKTVSTWLPETRFLFGYQVEDKLYIQQKGKGLFVKQGDSLALVKQGEVMVKGNIYGMESYGSKILIALKRKLILYDASADTTGGKSCFQDFETEADVVFKNAFIYGFKELPNQHYAVSTLEAGVVVVDKKGKITDVINEDNGLVNNRVLSINYFDKKLWMATNNGYAKAELSSPFRIWKDKNISSSTIWSIIRFQKKLYVASGNGIFMLDSQENKKFAKSSTFTRFGDSKRQAWYFLKMDNDKLLCSITDDVFVLDKSGETKSIIKKTAFVLNNYPKNKNIYFAGTVNSLLIMQYFPSTDSWKTKKIKDVAGGVRSMTFKDNTLWLGTTYNGLFKMDFNKVLNTSEVTEADYQVSHLVSENLTTGFTVSKNGDDIIIITSDGIYQYNPDLDKIIISNKFGDYFKEKGVFRFQENHKGQIWAGSAGLLTKTKDSYSLDSTFIKRLPFRVIESVFFDSTTNYWYLGSAEGLAYYNQKEGFEQGQKYEALLRKVTIKGDSSIFEGIFKQYADSLAYNLIVKEQVAENIPSIAYNYNTLNFDYSCNFYVEVEKIEYSYKLEGFDEEWSAFSAKTEKEYTNLSEGTYSFKVKAKNVYDLESEVATYQFEILSPWHRTWWAYLLYFILYIILATLVIYLIVKLNTRRLAQVRIKLEQTVELRTEEIREKSQELQQQKEEIATQNEELRQQQEEILVINENLESQTKDLRRKNTSITDSIRYAETIQKAILPSKNYRLKLFPESFILYRPKDIISGDFFWMKTVGTMRFVACVDCTGHGVPGAFMSMIGNSLLNEAIQHKHYKPSEILNYLSNNIRARLNQAEKKNADGMDISICRFEEMDNEKIKLLYAGAKSPIYVFKNSEMSILKGDRKSIGGVYYKKGFLFQDLEIELNKSDMLYLATDGYIDQSNPKRERFGSLQFRKILQEVHLLPLAEQKEVFVSELDKHQEKEKQRDDITMIGIQL